MTASTQQAAALRRAFGEPVRERHPAWAASVLAILVPQPDGLHLLLERRPDGPSAFGGQLCFPGGRIEPDDASALAAALRETREEVGLDARDLEVIGPLAQTHDPMDRPVSAFVALLARGASLPVPTSPAEVTEVLTVPIASLLSPGSVSGPYAAQRYECRLLPDAERLVQYWHLAPPRAGAPHSVLWGFTAGLTANLLHRAWGWQPPSPPRIIGQWADLRP